MLVGKPNKNEPRRPERESTRGVRIDLSVHLVLRRCVDQSGQCQCVSLTVLCSRRLIFFELRQSALADGNRDDAEARGGKNQSKERCRFHVRYLENAVKKVRMRVLLAFLLAHGLALAEGLAVQCEQDFFVTAQNQCQACPAGQVHEAGTCTNGPATACSVVPTSAPSASPSASPSAAAVLCSPGEEQARSRCCRAAAEHPFPPPLHALLSTAEAGLADAHCQWPPVLSSHDA